MGEQSVAQERKLEFQRPFVGAGVHDDVLLRGVVFGDGDPSRAGHKPPGLLGDLLGQLLTHLRPRVVLHLEVVLRHSPLSQGLLLHSCILFFGLLPVQLRQLAQPPLELLNRPLHEFTDIFPVQLVHLPQLQQSLVHLLAPITEAIFGSTSFLFPIWQLCLGFC